MNITKNKVYTVTLQETEAHLLRRAFGELPNPDLHRLLPEHRDILNQFFDLLRENIEGER